MTDNAIPAPAATDKTLKDLKGIRFKLSPSLDPRLVWFSSTFNSIYEDTTTEEETDTLFTDAAIRTVMVADPISVLKRLFATSFVPSATETDPDRTTRITSLIQACTLSYDGRRTPELLRRAYQVESAMIKSLSYTNRGVPDELVIHIQPHSNSRTFAILIISQRASQSTRRSLTLLLAQMKLSFPHLL